LTPLTPEHAAISLALLYSTKAHENARVRLAGPLLVALAMAMPR
jgi:hypothetical protein